jgi:hypothetical protein
MRSRRYVQQQEDTGDGSRTREEFNDTEASWSVLQLQPGTHPTVTEKYAFSYHRPINRTELTNPRI